MIKYLLSTLTLLLIALTIFAQDSGNKVCLTPSQFTTALRKDDSLQLMKKEVAALNNKADTLKFALANADSTANKFRLADLKSQSIINAKDGIIHNQEMKLDLAGILTTSLKKIIRRKNFKIKLISGLSLATTATLTYLLLKK